MSSFLEFYSSIPKNLLLTIWPFSFLIALLTPIRAGKFKNEKSCKKYWKNSFQESMIIYDLNTIQSKTKAIMQQKT